MSPTYGHYFALTSQEPDCHSSDRDSCLAVRLPDAKSTGLM